MNADQQALAVAQHLLGAEGTEWGIVIEEARLGYVRLGMTVRPDMTNGHGNAHGGMIFALADTAFAYACNARNEASVAASASILFLAPAPLGTQLVAEAREEALAGRSGAYSVLVRQRDGAAIAHFQGQSRKVGGPIIPVCPKEKTDG